MKKIIYSLIILAILSCDTGLEVNLDCFLKHTTEIVKLESSFNDIEKTFVNLSWAWTLSVPTGNGVIVERKINIDFDSIGYVSPIETIMTFLDTSNLLEPNREIFYRLGLLSNETIDYFDTTNFTIPSAQHIVQPDTEFFNLPNDTLEIIFGKLKEFDTTDVAIYETPFTSPDSLLNTPIQEVLDILTAPIVSTTVTDTFVKIYAPYTLIQINSVYAIKLSSSKISNLDYITDTSIGIRGFVRIQ